MSPGPGHQPVPVSRCLQVQKHLGMAFRTSLSRTACGDSASSSCLLPCNSPNPVEARGSFCSQTLVLVGGGLVWSRRLSGCQEPWVYFYREIV